MTLSLADADRAAGRSVVMVGGVAMMTVSLASLLVTVPPVFVITTESGGRKT